MATLGLTAVGTAPAGAVSICSATPDTVWDGDTSTDWSNAANWSAGVPTGSSRVCVPADMPNDPIISGGFSASVRSIEVEIGGTLSNNGSILNIAEASSIATLTLSGSGVQLVTDGALTVDTAFNMTQGSVTGGGSITSVIGANFATAGTKNIDVPFTNQGILTWNDGDLNFNNKTVTNSGEWRVPGTGDTLFAGQFNNGGTLTKSNAGNFTVDSPFTNTGTTTMSGTALMTVAPSRLVTVSGGALTITGAQFAHGAGTINISGGRTYTGAGGTITSDTINVTGGDLTGVGTYVGDVSVSSGRITAGDYQDGSVGALTITGSLTYTGGKLHVDINGTTPGSQYDTVAVSGAVSLSGATLEVRRGGYSPAGNSNYNVLTYASVSGTYSLTHDLSSTPHTGFFTTDYGTSPLTITARYNGDLSGYAFVDANADGSKGGGENTGLAGVSIYLDNNGSGTLDGGDQSTTSDANGRYEFNNIAPGSYNVRNNSTPSGYARSTTVPVVTNLPDNSTASANIGFYESIAIEGNVYNDANLNGINDAGDSPSGGRTVFLDTDNDGSLDGGEVSTTTNGSGDYIFPGLTPGTYRVRIVLPAGGIQTTTNPAPTTVSSGNGATGVNFGVDLVTGSIAGTVYVDTNGDGTKQGGETTPSVGTTVFLDTNHNGVRDGGERNVVTDSNGDYFFSQVQPGTYDVDVTNPGGWNQTSAELDSVVVATNTDVTGQNIGLFQAPSIGGTVYSDLNTDGVKDVGEPGIAGVTVFMDTDNNGSLDGGETSTTTDALGGYVFSGVAGGTYKIRMVDPAPGTQTTLDPADVVITSGNGAINVNFGVDAPGSIAGTVYVDANGNGAKDVSETTGMPGVTVFLDANNNGTLDGGEVSQITDASGDYLFSALKANTYDVDVVLPTGSGQTSVELDNTIVGLNQVVTGQNIGLFTLTSISGHVFQDTDTNGVADTGEPGIAGTTVYLDDDNSGAKNVGETEVVTDADGNFTISDLGPGPHRVRAVLPTGVVRTTANPGLITLASGTPSTGTEFGLDIFGSISGKVFVDTNGNNVRDGSENTGLANATMFFDDNHNGVLDAGEKSTTTDNAGNYTFTLVMPGDYDIDIVLPPGYTQTTSELDSVGFAVLNQDITGNDVGVYQDSVINGVVFFDQNENQVRDTAERGILGATVYLDDNSNGKLDAGERSAVTGEDGTYSIVGAGPGGHPVRVLSWGASQTTSNPPNAIVSSGSVFDDVTFGFDKGVVGSGDPTTQGTGYWMVGVDGRVYSFGDAKDFGSVDELSSPAAGLAPTITGDGYWVVTAGGGVNSFGDAKFHGSAARLNLNAPIIGITATPSGNGYWLLAADGGVFAYGDAKFFGSTGGMKLNAPVKAMAATSDGNGYWLVASDGGVFAFGNAPFKGSMGGKPLNKPVVGIAGTSTGDGYLLVAEDGGMFIYDATFLGSAADLKLDGPIVGIRARGDSRGYWLVGADGGLFAYGEAPFYGNAKANKTAPIVG